MSVGACSSTSTTPPVDGGTAPADGGLGLDSGLAARPDGATGPDPMTPDASTAGKFVFTIEEASTANLMGKDFKPSEPAQGSFCMGKGPNTSCSFTGSIYANSCLTTLNIAFTGDPTMGASFPLVKATPVAEGKGFVAYGETCGTDTKSWTGADGTITVTKIERPAAGLTMGTITLRVIGANMSPATNGAGTAAGTFEVAGVATEITYSGSP